jgi:hypothetical protein
VIGTGRLLVSGIYFIDSFQNSGYVVSVRLVFGVCCARNIASFLGGREFVICRCGAREGGRALLERIGAALNVIFQALRGSSIIRRVSMLALSMC